MSSHQVNKGLKLHFWLKGRKNLRSGDITVFNGVPGKDGDATWRKSTVVSIKNLTILKNYARLEISNNHRLDRSYTRPFKLSLVYCKSSYKITLPLYNGSLNCCLFYEPYSFFLLKTTIFGQPFPFEKSLFHFQSPISISKIGDRSIGLPGGLVGYMPQGRSSSCSSVCI